MPEGDLTTRQLFDRHADFVAAFLVRLHVRSPDTEDLLQEVFLTAHRLGGYRAGPASPKTWLARIALGAVSTFRRTARRKHEVVDDEAVGLSPASGSGPAQAAENAESLALVERSLARLDEEHRTVFVLFELEREPCDAIAAALGIPVGTVYSRLHNARRDFLAGFERLSTRGAFAPTQARRP